jgi:hypothetical protein
MYVVQSRNKLTLYAWGDFAKVDATRPTKTATRPTAAVPATTWGDARRSRRV